VHHFFVKLYSRFSLSERKGAAKEAEKRAVLSLVFVRLISSVLRLPSRIFTPFRRKNCAEPHRKTVVYRTDLVCKRANARINLKFLLGTQPRGSDVVLRVSE
jgi:hypothetical protein